MKQQKHKNLDSPHATWHRFSNWLIKTYGKDLHGKWEYIEGKDANGKPFKRSFRSFDDVILSKRLVGIDVMNRIRRYVNRYCPDINIISCDDSTYAGSFLLLIPHPRHGITIIFVPQCTEVNNQFFLYECDRKALVKSLQEIGNSVKII